MPIEVGQTLPEGVYEGNAFTPEANWLEVNTAAFSQESVFANWLNVSDNPMPMATEDDKQRYLSGEYDPLADLKGTKFEGSALEKFYTQLESPEQVQWQMARHENEIATRTTVGDGFFEPLVGTVAGALAGPLTLATGVGFKLPLTVGKRMAAAAGINVGITAMDEFMLHQTQHLRTKEESLLSAGLAGLLGGAVGRIGAERVAPEMVRVKPEVSFTDHSPKAGGAAKVVHDIELDEYNVIMDDETVPMHERIAKVHEKQGERYAVANPWAVKFATFGGLLNKIMPDMHMATNESSVMRRLAGKMLNSPLVTEGHKMGFGDIPLDEIAARQDDIIDAGIDKAFSTGHANYLKQSGKISREEFDRLVQKAVAKGNKSDIPAVAQAAKEFDDISKYVGRKAVKEGLLEGDEAGNPLAPLGDDNWFQRTWSSNYALRTDETAYANTLADLHIDQLKRMADEEVRVLKAKNLPTVKEKLAELNDVTIPKLKKDLKAALKGKDKLTQFKLKDSHKKKLVELRKEANKAEDMPASKKYEQSLKATGVNSRDSIIGRYRGMHRQVRSGDGLEQGGSVMRIGFDGELAKEKGRTVNIPTEFIPDEFLEGDAVLSVTRSLKRLNRQIVMKEDARFGNDVLGNFKDELLSEFDAKRAILDAQGKSTKKLADKHTKNLQYINGILKEYYGLRPPPANELMKNIAQSMKMFSVLTKLGSVMASTLPEVASALNTAGVRGYMRHVSGWVLDSKSMRDMTRAQKADYALALDSSMSLRLAEMGEYDSGMGSKMRAMHKGTDVILDKAFGLGIWTRQLTAQAGVMVQSKIGRLMLKKTLSKQDVTDLARMGISKDVTDSIRSEVVKHHKKATGGAVDMRIGQWDNKQLAEDVMSAVFSEVDNTIIKPRTGSTPFIGKSASGSLFLQFKQFLMASTSKYWISDVQRLVGGDIRAAERMIGFMGMGAVSWAIKKNYLYGQGDKEETTKEQIMNALSHGGGMGIAMEMFNFVDQGINKDNSRYSGNRTGAGMFFGPGPSLGYDALMSAMTATKMIKGDEITKGELRQMRRIVPMNNWIPARPLFNMGERAAYDQFGKEND